MTKTPILFCKPHSRQWGEAPINNAAVWELMMLLRLGVRAWGEFCEYARWSERRKLVFAGLQELGKPDSLLMLMSAPEQRSRSGHYRGASGRWCARNHRKQVGRFGSGVEPSLPWLSRRGRD
jgi:hypothetical protein